jgi:hypothetical protein
MAKAKLLRDYPGVGLWGHRATLHEINPTVYGIAESRVSTGSRWTRMAGIWFRNVILRASVTEYAIACRTGQ